MAAAHYTQRQSWRKRIMLDLFSRLEDREVNSVSHRLVTRVIWVQVIAGIELRFEALRVVGIAGGGFEVDDRVEGTRGPDPLIDSRPDRFAVLASVARSFVRRQRAADDFDPMRVCAIDDLLKDPDQIVFRDRVGWRFAAPSVPMSLMPSRIINHFTPG